MARRASDAPESPVRARGAIPTPDLVLQGADGAESPLSALYDVLSEKELQAMVVAGLKQRGYFVWIVPDMRKTLAGLPDIIAVSPQRVTHPRRVLFWELKTAHGRVRAAQRVALAALDGIEGVDARIVRPRDWAAISATLDLAAGAPSDEIRG